MARLFSFLFFFVLFGHWIIQLIAAAGFAYLGMQLQSSDTARLAARQALIAQAPPETVDVATFRTSAPGNIPVEVSVRGQLALSHNTELIRKTNFIKTGSDLMYVLVGETATTDNVAQAIMIVSPSRKDEFISWLKDQAVGFGPVGPIVQ
ncbi:MAG: hypothetical protein ABI459_04105, partial [Deltaproteobacteria bacterium]